MSGLDECTGSEVWQHISVCGDRIYLCLKDGEYGSIIQGTALTLLEEKMWDEEWEHRRNGTLPRKRYWKTKIRGYLRRLSKRLVREK